MRSSCFSIRSSTTRGEHRRGVPTPGACGWAPHGVRAAASARTAGTARGSRELPVFPPLSRCLRQPLALPHVWSVKKPTSAGAHGPGCTALRSARGAGAPLCMRQHPGAMGNAWVARARPAAARPGLPRAWPGCCGRRYSERLWLRHSPLPSATQPGQAEAATARLHLPKNTEHPRATSQHRRGTPRPPPRRCSPSPAPASAAGSVHNLSQMSRGDSSRRLGLCCVPARRSQPRCPHRRTVPGCPRGRRDVLSSRPRLTAPGPPGDGEGRKVEGKNK